MTNEENCKHEDKIIEMYGLVKEQASDIKWLCLDARRRNGIMESHIADSDKYRDQSTRNTTWRHVFKIAVMGTYVCISALWLYFFYHIANIGG